MRERRVVPNEPRAAGLGVPLLCALLAACSSEPPGYDGPASVVHDPEGDVYLVANVHGAAMAKDGNGYIARVQPDGGMQRHWLQGGRGGIVLHAPAGMALHGEELWVADIDVLRAFDRRTGRPRREVSIPGASCLAGVSIAPDGTIYCTDRGLDASSVPTGTDAIWRLGADGIPLPLCKGVELGQPTGIVAREQGVYVVSWRDGTFYQVDTKGRRTDLGKAPRAQLQGLVRIEAAGAGQAAATTAWFATSWAGNCVYRFDTTGACTVVGAPLAQPAHLGWDRQRGRLLVPLSGADRLEIRPVEVRAP